MKFKNIKRIIPAVAVVLLLSSCLKDDNVDQDFSKLTPMVGFADATPSGTGPNTTNVGVKSENAETTFNLEVVYMTDKSNPGVTINLAEDAASLAELAASTGRDYVILTPDQFELPATFTIPAGQQSAILPVKLKPSLISPPGNEAAAALTYALPIKITGANNGAGASANFGRHIFIISIKNPWDGTYHSTGVFTHPTAGPRDIDEEKVLATTSPTSNLLFLADLRPSTMEVDIDPATNLVTVVGAVSATQPLIPTPGKTSTYDPATKTFHLYYQYTGGGGFRVVEEHLEYVGE